MVGSLAGHSHHYILFHIIKQYMTFLLVLGFFVPIPTSLTQVFTDVTVRSAEVDLCLLCTLLAMLFLLSAFLGNRTPAAEVRWVKMDAIIVGTMVVVVFVVVCH